MVARLHFAGETIEPTELERRIALVAGGLAGLGIRAGDVVALMLRNEPAAIEVTLACNRLGAYHCPVNWHFREQELAFILQDSGAKALFIHADLLPRAAGAIPAGVTVLSVAPSPYTQRACGIGPGAARAPALDYHQWRERQVPYAGPAQVAPGRFAYTSGTTGRPKGVRRLPETLHPEQPRLLEEAVRLTFGFDAHSRVYLSAPLYHGAPNLYGVQAALRAESLLLEPRFDAETTLRLIEQYRLSHLYLVPTMCVRLLALPAEVKRRHDLSAVRFVASTGSPFSPEVKRAMIEWWGPVIYESYASSETGMVTVIDSAQWLRRPGSVGRPVGAAQVKIVSDEGRELGAGEIGNIYVRQPAYADFTYHNLPQARRDVAYGDLVCVGDVGYLDAEGYLYICDRKSDMVISGGVNIYPAETEGVLGAMPGVADCAVFGIPDPEFGESLAAVVQPQPGAQLDAEAVRAYLKARIAGYKVPKVVEFMPSLPREDSGKIMKRKLRAPYWRRAGRQI
jgi:long-chain acyl-CoA synthetase